jgi:hypothetical protein
MLTVGTPVLCRPFVDLPVNDVAQVCGMLRDRALTPGELSRPSVFECGIIESNSMTNISR